LGINFKLLALGARKYGVVVISFKVSAQESKPVKSQNSRACVQFSAAVPHLLTYSASKFALVGFSEALRMEMAKYGIWVTTVCPLIRTGSPRNADFIMQDHDRIILRL
jgi:NAD(P)-dependent dehydrogenase (short-subunit alcohol dehydrogenase family)